MMEVSIDLIKLCSNRKIMIIIMSDDDMQCGGVPCIPLLELLQGIGDALILNVSDNRSGDEV